MDNETLRERKAMTFTGGDDKVLGWSVVDDVDVARQLAVTPKRITWL